MISCCNMLSDGSPSVLCTQARPIYSRFTKELVHTTIGCGKQAIAINTLPLFGQLKSFIPVVASYGPGYRLPDPRFLSYSLPPPSQPSLELLIGRGMINTPCLFSPPTFKPTSSPSLAVSAISSITYYSSCLQSFSSALPRCLQGFVDSPMKFLFRTTKSNHR